MFGYIRGKLTKTSPLYVIIETHGVGYKLFIPTSTHVLLPQEGAELLFFTSFVVREFSHSLYGFLVELEKDLFELLLNITGIGPKIALAILSHLSPDQFYEAISNNDLPQICKIPGIGKKSAERLVIETRDKLTYLFPKKNLSANKLSASSLILDAMSALINLGYNQATAEKALKKTMNDLPESQDLAKLITTSLNYI